MTWTTSTYRLVRLPYEVEKHRDLLFYYMQLHDIASELDMHYREAKEEILRLKHENAFMRELINKHMIAE